MSVFAFAGMMCPMSMWKATFGPSAATRSRRSTRDAGFVLSRKGNLRYSRGAASSFWRVATSFKSRWVFPPPLISDLSAKVGPQCFSKASFKAAASVSLSRGGSFVW